MVFVEISRQNEGRARFWSVGPAFWIYATNFTGVGSKLVIFIISNIFIITHLLANLAEVSRDRAKRM